MANAVAESRKVSHREIVKESEKESERLCRYRASSSSDVMIITNQTQNTVLSKLNSQLVLYIYLL